MATPFKLVFTYWGEGIALGIYGSKEEIIRISNGLYNYEAVDGDPIWLCENKDRSFGYVVTTWEKLKKAYTAMYITACQQSSKHRSKRLKRGYITIAEEKAERKIRSIIPERFLEFKGEIVDQIPIGETAIKEIEG